MCFIICDKGVDDGGGGAAGRRWPSGGIPLLRDETQSLFRSAFISLPFFFSFCSLFFRD